MQTKVVWINKATWKKPGPIAYMGLLNAMAFAWQGQATDFFISGRGNEDIASDLQGFYGLQPHELLTIHPVSKQSRGSRGVYQAALQAIESYCQQGHEVLAITRELGLLAALIRLRRRYPALRVLHEVHDYYGSVKHLPERRLASYRRMLAERWLLGKLDGLICLTEYQRALYQQWLPDLPMLVLPLGSAQLNQPAPRDLLARQQQRSVAYIGRLHSYKGLTQIMQLAKALIDTGVTIHCYGGKQSQVDELTDQARQQNTEAVLRFHPFMSPVDLERTLTREIAIGLVPLQDTYYSRYLTCPVKALDFLRLGLPIVGSNVPCVKDVVASAGLLVDPMDINGYRENILSLLDDVEAFQSMAQAGFERSLELSWAGRAKAILNFDHALRSAALGTKG